MSSNEFGSGWDSLLNQLEQVEVELLKNPYYAGPEKIYRDNGMLKIVWNAVPESQVGLVLLMQAFAYQLERQSAKLCETCGEYGLRRTNLKLVQCLCTKCYAIAYSAESAKSSSTSL